MNVIKTFNELTDLTTTDNLTTDGDLIKNSANVTAKEIINKINKLTVYEKKHILNYLILNNISYTKNINGYFFNLGLNNTNITSDLLVELSNKIDLMELHRNEIANIDKDRDVKLQQCKKLIEKKMTEKIKLKNEEYNNKIKLHDENDNIHLSFTKIQKPLINYDKEIDDFDKKKSYNKNSVYYRILNRFRLKKFTKRINKESYNEVENDDDVPDIRDSYIRDISDDNVMDDENIIDDEIDLDDIELDQDDIENDQDDDDDADDNDDDNIEDEKSYYKKLLNMHGFIFDQDKSCLLTLQEYIY